MGNHYFPVRIAVTAVIEKDGKCLLQRRFNTGWRDGYFSMVGGHADGKESLKSALIRELKEEIGIDVQESDLDLVHILHISPKVASDEFIYNVFKVKAYIGTPSICEPEKSDALEWFDIHALPENTIPIVKRTLNLINTGSNYSQYGWLPDEVETT